MPLSFNNKSSGSATEKTGSLPARVKNVWLGWLKIELIVSSVLLVSRTAISREWHDKWGHLRKDAQHGCQAHLDNSFLFNEIHGDGMMEGIWRVQPFCGFNLEEIPLKWLSFISQRSIRGDWNRLYHYSLTFGSSVVLHWGQFSTSVSSQALKLIQL